MFVFRELGARRWRIERGAGSWRRVLLGGPMERDNYAGTDSDGIMYGGDASFGAPDQSQLSTFDTTLVDDRSGHTER